MAEHHHHSRPERRRQARRDADVDAFIENKVKPLIRREGWMVQAVGPDVHANPPSCGFAYTVGMTPAGWPEFITYGLSPAVGAALLNDLARRIIRGDLEPLEGPVEKLANMPLELVAAVEPAAVPVNIARRLYGDVPRVMQLCWPDPEGRFQWEPGFESPFVVPFHGDPERMTGADA